MTDGITPANGHRPGAESARNTRQRPPDTSGYDAGTWEESMMTSDSGEASAWTTWPPSRPPQPGAASPAGWFQPTGGEAAPPFRPGMEPARSDETAERPGYATVASVPDGHWFMDPQPTAVHPVPRSWSRPSSAEPGQLPAVGPTEARRGRAGGPGLTAPPGAVPGLLDPERRSCWQLAQQVWQESGVSWEPAGPAPAGLAAPAGPARAGGLGHRGPVWARPAVSAVKFDDDGGDRAQDWGPIAENPGPPAENWDEPAEEWDEPAEEWGEPDGAEPGADWADPGDRELDFDADADADADESDAADWPASGTRPGPLPPQAFAAMPLGAPVAVERQVSWSAETPGPTPVTAARPLSEPDALFRAWQGSVRQAADPRRRWSAPRPGMTVRRRRHAWRVVTIGVPAAVIVTVGAGALMMLTGRANEMLAVRGNTAAVPPGAAASGTAPGGGGTRVTGMTLAGYPGQHGSVAADSIWTAAGVSLAVGDADGHPAIWRESGGSWVLVPAAALGAVAGTGNLTAVAHGPAGWIAVGLTATGRSTSSLVLTSADGVSWQPVAALADAAGSDVEFLGVAAGSDGYAVVGRKMIGGRAFAVLWWSADLRMWVQGANGGLDGRLTASTAGAAAATATGFVAVGSHGALPAIWTSPDGAHWNLGTVPAPPGARSAMLRQVVASGNTIVAAGSAATAAGDVPLAVVSTDGGTHWRSVVLPAPGGLGTVTALTTAGNRLVAAGQSGPAGARHFVTWTSPDGLRWSPATAVAGVRQLSALSASDGTLTGTGTSTAQPGADPAIMAFPAR